MTFIEVKSLRRNQSVHKKKAMNPTFSKEQQWHKPYRMLQSNSIQNKLSKAYQTKLNRNKSKKSFLSSISENIQIHNQIKMSIGTIVKLLEGQNLLLK